MEQFLLLLLRHIAEQHPELSLVTEDCGQLETQEDTYPVTFPCVLVGNTDITWSDICEQNHKQKGDGTITVRLAFDLYDDVHVGSGQEDSISDRQEKVAALHKALQGLEFDEAENVWPLSRVKSTDYTLPGNIKVYENIYSFTVRD